MHEFAQVSVYTDSVTMLPLLQNRNLKYAISPNVLSQKPVE